MTYHFGNDVRFRDATSHFGNTTSLFWNRRPTFGIQRPPLWEYNVPLVMAAAGGHGHRPEHGLSLGLLRAQLGLVLSPAGLNIVPLWDYNVPLLEYNGPRLENDVSLWE